jgi:hypothetical protein
MRHKRLYLSASQRFGFLLAALLGFSMVPGPVTAQVNSGINYNQHFTTVAANNQPALLGKSFDNWEVGIANTYAWFSNNSLSVKEINDVANTDVLTESDVERTIRQFETESLFSAGAVITPLQAGVKIHDDQDKELLTFSVAAGAEVLSNVQLNRTFVSLAWNGNRQYRDQNIRLGEIKVNALPMRTYSLGVAAPFELGDVDLRAGLRFSYLEGIGSAYTEDGDLSLYTNPNARSLELESNVKANVSIPDTDAEVSDVPVDISRTGNGIGVDAGVNIRVDEQISFGLSVADLGSVTFTEETENYSRTGPYEFTGVDLAVGRPDEDGEDLALKADSLGDVIDYEETEEDYTMPLGARGIFQTHLRVGKDIHKRDTFYQHHIYLHYQQGFQNHLRATERSVISFGYTYNLNNDLNAGGSVTFGGYTQAAVGPYLSTRLGPFKLGLGSNNMLALIDEGAANGGDVSFNMALAF